MVIDGHVINDNDDNDDSLDLRLRRSWQLAITSKGFSQQPIHINTSSISHRHCDEDDASDDEYVGDHFYDYDDLVHLPPVLPAGNN